MRIIFVRHGEPDYEHDCLTDRGLVQAEAAAARLEGEGIEEILFHRQIVLDTADLCDQGINRDPFCLYLCCICHI